MREKEGEYARARTRAMRADSAVALAWTLALSLIQWSKRYQMRAKDIKLRGRG